MITIVVEKTEDSVILHRALKALLKTDLSGVDKILVYHPNKYPIPPILKREVVCVEGLTRSDCVGSFLIFIDPTAVLVDKDWIALLLDGMTEREYTCSSGRDRSTRVPTSYGSAMSVDPLYYLDLTPITNKPSNRSLVSVPTGPVRMISTEWYWKLDGLVSSVPVEFRDHAFGLAAWQNDIRCTVVPNLSVLYDPQIINPHPYVYYSSKFSLMRRLGFCEDFIKSCVSDSPIIQNAYQLSLENIERELLFDFDIERCDEINSKIVTSYKVSFNKFKWNTRPPNLAARFSTFGKAIELTVDRMIHDPQHVIAPESVRKERMDICTACMARSQGMCTVCGCFVAVKIVLATEACALSPPLWPSV